MLFFQTLTSAVLPLLYVTLMPTAPILVDLITALARQDTVAMEKLAKVGENTLVSLKVSQFTAVPPKMVLGTCDII